MLHHHSGASTPPFLNDTIWPQNLNADAQKKIFSELASFQWIHTSDELPRLGERVLLFFNRSTGKSFSKIIVGQLVYSAGKDTCYLLDCGEVEPEAEYWMPLPFKP